MSDQLRFVWDQLPNLLWGFPNHRPGGLLLSILLTAAALLAGFVISVPVALGLHSRWAVVRFVARRYVWLIRGIPLIVLLILAHQFLAAGRVPGITTSALGSAFVVLALYASAYFADVIDAGISAMPQQYVDDARLLGAGRRLITQTVTLPYVLNVMRPALATQAITVFKDSSVVVVLGVAELTTNARIALGSDVENAPYWVTTYLVVGALYFVVAYGASRLTGEQAINSAARGISSRRGWV